VKAYLWSIVEDVAHSSTRGGSIRYEQPKILERGRHERGDRPIFRSEEGKTRELGECRGSRPENLHETRENVNYGGGKNDLGKRGG